MNMKKDFLKDKNIMVIGGTGSFGSAIVKHLLDFNPEVIRIFSRDEDKQYHMQYELQDYKNIRYLIGDIRNKGRLLRAMEGIDIVFHAAALKHVASCEYNPFEAVKTNIVGTQNVIDAALNCNVSMVVYTSSDKAVNPTSAMGTSKLMAEKLISTANFYKGPRKTILYSVRFGNVLGSRGSAIDRFLKQIKSGEAVTLTHSEMTRFVMSTNEAVDLVLRTTTMAKGGEIFILKMPALKIEPLIHVLIKGYAPKVGMDPDKIKIREIGPKPGEKLYEELMTNEENSRVFETDDMFIVMPPFGESSLSMDEYEGAHKPEMSGYTSNDAKLLSEKEIKEIVNAGQWFDEERL